MTATFAPDSTTAVLDVMHGIHGALNAAEREVVALRSTLHAVQEENAELRRRLERMQEDMRQQVEQTLVEQDLNGRLFKALSVLRNAVAWAEANANANALPLIAGGADCVLIPRQILRGAAAVVRAEDPR